MIKAGKMDRKIVFQRDNGTTEDAIGHPIKNYQTLRTEWASVEPVSGSEAFKSGRDLGERVARFTCHYFAGLTEKDRISYDSEYWDIQYIREIGRKELLEVMAQTAR